MPRKSGDRTRRIFENTRSLAKMVRGHTHLAREITSKHHDGAPCVFVDTYRALVRVVGYLKYNTTTPVVLRGQTRCYGSMKALLHRRSTPPTDAKIEAFLRRYRSCMQADLKETEKLSTEPLLQHYGLETRWLDVVDSVPHALFFATHTMVKSPSHANRWTFVYSRERYGFLYVIDTGLTRPIRRHRKRVEGLTKGSDGLLIADLRKLKPSIALRPHAQHGLLIRETRGDPDIWKRVVGRIAVPTSVARRWIASAAFEPEEFFPSRDWDGVFGHLLSMKMNNFLQDEEARGRNWGNIQLFDFHET